MRTGIADCLAHAGRWDGVFQGNLLIGFACLDSVGQERALAMLRRRVRSTDFGELPRGCYVSTIGKPHEYFDLTVRRHKPVSLAGASPA